jgi:hypothetical protein
MTHEQCRDDGASGDPGRTVFVRVEPGDGTPTGYSFPALRSPDDARLVSEIQDGRSTWRWVYKVRDQGRVLGRPTR